MNCLKQISDKIVDDEGLSSLIKIWKKNNEKIVFTNGCFDIIHRGHITYLAEARALGSKLVIGVNSDQSVRGLNKAPNRPINAEDDRSFHLAALQSTDGVIVFDESTPLQLIQLVRPDILVKGGDYDASCLDEKSKDYVVGSKEVIANGGQVKVLTFVEGYSTTSFIEKVKK